MRQAKVVLAAALAAGVMAMPLCGQSGAAAPHAAGTVKATSDTGLTLTTSTGDVYTVTVPSTAKVLVVAPGSKDLKAATAGSLSDVAPADKAIVTGTAGDTGLSLTAVRVILMKSQAIADSHAAEDAAWAQGGGGIVRSVDAAAGTITVGRGTKTLNVTVGPATIIRRYAGDSVRFADAQASTLAAIQPGDQLRVRGTKSADGSTIAADELVTGSFRNYSGLIASITPGGERRNGYSNAERSYDEENRGGCGHREQRCAADPGRGSAKVCSADKGRCRCRRCRYRRNAGRGWLAGRSTACGRRRCRCRAARPRFAR